MRVLATCTIVVLWALSVFAQQADPQGPVVVQPGAPGEPTRTLPSSTRPTLPSTSPADVQFMQHMIMHHAQAVEMTALIESHTPNQELRTLGARISRSQSDEMKFMKRWLEARVGKQEAEGSAADMHNMTGTQPAHQMTHMHQTQAPSNQQMPHTHETHTSSNQMLMPGMLSAEQMDALRKASGDEFDRLFLSGMIQHHNGALVMVKELFDTPGAGEDAELFSFATDVDSGQRAEIRVMEKMLGQVFK